MAWNEIVFTMGFLSAAMAVGLGGARAHLLERHIPRERLAMLEVGMRYQFIHSMGLLWTAQRGAARFDGLAVVPAALFIAGIVLFCAAMYGYAFTGRKGLLKVTPAGGLLFVCGWLALAAGVWM